MIDSELLYKLIGERIRRFREAHIPRLSQDGLARALGLKRTSITNIECGNQKLTLDSLYKLCDRFGLEVGEFIPSVSEVTHSEGQSVVIGGKAHEVGMKTANLVARLRPIGKVRRQKSSQH